MDKHELVQDLIRVAQELGHSPTRKEYLQFGKYAYRFENIFGSFSVFLHAAGLESVKNKKISNSIFEVDIDKHFQKYTPKKPRYKPLKYYPTLAIISDIHWPFSVQKVIDKFYEYVSETLPDYVIINGDAWDMYSHAKFPRSHNVFTPREEQRLAREANEIFWKKIQELSPKSKCYQLMGNHDIRPLKRVMETYPEAEDWVKEKIQNLFTFEGVVTVHDPREELEIDEETLVFHGYKTKLGDHRDYVLMNVFNGHSHVGGCVARRVHGRTITETNSGYAGDPEAKGLTYTPIKITNWTHGFAARDKWGSRFIPV